MAVNWSVPITLRTASAALDLVGSLSSWVSGSVGIMIFPSPAFGKVPSSGIIVMFCGEPRSSGIWPTKRPSKRAGLRDSERASFGLAKARDRTHSTWVFTPWVVMTSTSTVLWESLARSGSIISIVRGSRYSTLLMWSCGRGFSTGRNRKPPSIEVSLSTIWI